MTDRPKVEGAIFRGIIIGLGLSLPCWFFIAYLVVRYG